MFTRTRDFLYRLAPLLAFRKSREIAAGTGGVIFALNNLAKVPMKQFFYGLGPAISTAAIGLVNFLYHLYNHYQTSDPKSTALLIRKNEIDCSTKLILNKFNSDSEKAEDFLKYYNISNDKIIELRLVGHIDTEDLNDILNELYNNTITFDFTKYTAATAFGILNAGCHFMEALLLKAFYDITMFDYPYISQAILFIVVAVALSNALLTFVEVKHAYENPPLAQQCDRIMKLFDEHSYENVSQQDTDFVTSSENAMDLAY